MPDVATEAKTKGKCAISTLIFRKFSGAMLPDPHTGEGLRRPSLDSLRASLGTSIFMSPLIKNPGYAPVNNNIVRSCRLFTIKSLAMALLMQ